jgi:F-type H+-transporting ATPase subunit delta
MFSSQRWAAAFINSLGSEACEGLEALKSLAGLIKRIPGALFGSSSAEKLEALVLCSAVSPSPALRIAARFTALLVKKNQIRFLGRLIGEIETLLDRQKGILHISVESALPLEDEAEWHICEGIKKRTGAREIRLEKRINPELIGGFRLRLGDEIIDVSVRHQLRQMTACLNAVPGRGGN